MLFALSTVTVSTGYLRVGRMIGQWLPMDILGAVMGIRRNFYQYQWLHSTTISPLRKDADSTIMNPMKTKSVLL